MKFETWNEYLDFKNSVIGKSRFFIEDQACSFLDKLFHASEKRKKIIEKDMIFYRAQLGYDKVEASRYGNEVVYTRKPYMANRMKPSKEFSKGGRANPPGLTYLYLATTPETALGEMRPWVGVEISCAEFKAKKNLTIADFFTNAKDASYLPKQITPEDVEDCIYYHVNYAFSEPATQDESAKTYVPTQIISEYFKKHGYDGIAYKSSLGEGYNLVVFDVEAFEPISCQIFKADEVRWKFAQSIKITY